MIKYIGKMEKPEKLATTSDLIQLSNIIYSDKSIACKDEISPYEKKYYALLRRCESIKMNNECLVNRIYHVKKLLRKRRKEREFLMKRLDKYGDDYKTASSLLLNEIFGGDSPPSHLPSQNDPSSSSQNFPLIQPKPEPSLHCKVDSILPSKLDNQWFSHC